MAAPTRYTPSYDFTGFQSANPNTPLPADKIEIEINNISTTTGELIDNLGIIQRSDGKLNNGIVEFDSLSNQTKALLGSPLVPRGIWAASTNYKILDLVTVGNTTYLSTVDHTSGGSFTADMTAGKWLLWANPGFVDGTSFFQKFSGNGSATAFTLSQDMGTDENGLMIFINNSGWIPQDPAAFTVSGTTLTFLVAPPNASNNIYVFAPAKLLAQAAAYAAAAGSSATAAAASATTASGAATTASAEAVNAANSAVAAAGSATTASSAATSATSSASTASTAATTASSAATTASGAATSATSSASTASTAATTASSAATTASSAATTASTAATTASAAAATAVAAAALVPLNNLSAITNPSVNDDSADGYNVGSIWVNVSTDKAWIMTASTVGAAEWQALAGSASSGGAANTSFVDLSKPDTFLVGINMSGAEFDTGSNGSNLPGVYSTNYLYPDDASLEWVMDNGIGEIIRLPFRHERLQQTLGGDFDTAELARLEAKCALILAAGKRVILDPHNYAQYYFKPHNLTATITNVTQANPAVLTYAPGGDFEEGDFFNVTGVVGMTQLNGNNYGVKNLNKVSRTFELFAWDGWQSNVNSTGYGAYTSGGSITHPKYGYYYGQPRLPDSYLVDFLVKLGSLEWVQSNPNVQICITNEPNIPGNIGATTLGEARWFTTVQTVVSAMRAAGINNRLKIPVTGFTGAHDFFGKRSHIYFKNLYDPIDNWCFDLHQYLDSDNSGTTTTVQYHQYGPKAIAPVVEWCRQHGFKLSIGETNAGDYNSAATTAEVKALVNFLDYMIANQDVVEDVNFWAGGERWGPTYMFQMQPADLVTDPVPARTAALIARKRTTSFINPAAVLAMDFANNRVYGVNTFTDILTVTQAGQTLTPQLDGTWSITPPNTLRMSGRGLLTELTKTNYLPSNTVPQGFFDTSAQAGQGLSPDGQLNANLLLDNSNNTWHASNWSDLSGIVNGDTVCYSIFSKYESGYAQYAWWKCAKPDSRTCPDMLTPQDQYPQTKDWVRSVLTFTHSGGVESPSMGFQPLQPNPSAGHIPDSYAGGTGRMLIWAKQCEKGIFPSSPIALYATGSATRATDVVMASGFFLSLLQGSNVTLVYTVAKAPEVALNLPLLTLNVGGTPVNALYRTDDYKIASDIGSTQETAAPGSGAVAYRQSFRVGVSVRNTGTERVVVGFEGGTSIGQNVTVPAVSDAQIGPFEGFIEKIEVFNTFYDTTALDTLLLEQ